MARSDRPRARTGYRRRSRTGRRRRPAGSGGGSSVARRATAAASGRVSGRASVSGAPRGSPIGRVGREPAGRSGAAWRPSPGRAATSSAADDDADDADGDQDGARAPPRIARGIARIGRILAGTALDRPEIAGGRGGRTGAPGPDGAAGSPPARRRRGHGDRHDARRAGHVRGADDRLERGGHRRAVRVAIAGLRRERASDDAVERRGDLRADRPGRGRRRSDAGEGDRVGRVAGPRPRAGEGLVQHEAQAVDVGGRGRGPCRAPAPG